MKTTLILITILMMNSNLFSQTTRSADEAKGLATGQKAPLFSAIDAENELFNLSQALESGPVVLIFYRGHWCPVCNKHLSSIQDSLNQILDKGATVVAVSPEKPEYLEKMSKKTKAEFRLLYDEDYKISDAYDVTFTPDNRQLVLYNTVLNAKLKETHSDDSQRLPIPATYIISREGRIAWRQFDPDYRNRSAVKDILANLPE